MQKSLSFQEAVDLDPDAPKYLKLNPLNNIDVLSHKLGREIEEMILFGGGYDYQKVVLLARKYMRMVK